jgi:hypothetical protein
MLQAILTISWVVRAGCKWAIDILTMDRLMAVLCLQGVRGPSKIPKGVD